MKTLEEKIEVMQAFLDGKTIQDNIDGEWADWESTSATAVSFVSNDQIVWTSPLAETSSVDHHLQFNWGQIDYRIKPENKQVPYDFSDAESLIGRKLKSKIDGFFHLITLVDNDSVLLSGTKWVRLDNLDSIYVIWNNTLDRWESCTKTVKG